jgi:rhamnogalacturonyl hydrolase YesR
LFYRDKNFFTSVEANGLPVFWSRGNGWVIGGLTRILKYMPADWPGRPQYVQLFRDMCARLAAIQMDSGGWSSSLLYPEKYNYDTEVSGTSFFVYGMAYGINSGILDRATYGPVVEKGWQIMNANLNEDGSISNIQTVGLKPGPNDDLVDKREYGYGAFILAGVQMAEYYSAASGSNWSGFPVTEAGGQRWADTGSFLGWLEISSAPYLYSQSLAGWVYLVEDPQIQQTGAWTYIFK